MDDDEMERLRLTSVGACLRSRPHRRAWFSFLAAAAFIAACSSSQSDDGGPAPPAAGAGGTGGKGEAGGTGGGNEAGTNAAAGGGAGAAGSEAAAAGMGGASTDVPPGSGGEGGTPDSTSNAGASGASKVTFVPAPHAPFPLVTAHGGPVLSRIELVPVYFANDPLQAELESFNTWIVNSDYWKTIGADYGVLPGTRLPPVSIASLPPATTSDAQIASWLDARIADGTVPKPSAQTLLALFYPASTTVTSGASKSCSGFAGLHESTAVSNAVFTGKVPFVIIPRCSFSPGDELEIATDVASHEYAEAATDPFSTSAPAWYLDGKDGQPLEAWQMLNGLEVADLCENQSYDVVEGFTVQDSWSNSAAQAGNNPCQPSDLKHPFFSVSTDATIVHAQPGAMLAVHATAWSNRPTPDWEIGVNWGYTPDSNFDGKATLSRTTVNNGDQVTATIAVPANPPVVGGRSVYRFTIDSIDPINPNFDHAWPIMIVVP
jgi:hypothetical protein